VALIVSGVVKAVNLLQAGILSQVRIESGTICRRDDSSA
jgi:hypothetical protein